ncbi:hypothetical protein AYI69_g4277 [Smittium culicis]|uniref:Uncharacterized protein n=1 Tax=Smittium culicis TaxID=133412 RepID=A0A1R1YEZ7_9FUNG|nr:hypothetical protein AYI69_g4277 [Smittium culicis]
MKHVARPLTVTRIFEEEVSDAERGHNRDPKRPPLRGRLSYAQICVIRTGRQMVGSEHSYTGIQNPIHEPKLGIALVSVGTKSNGGSPSVQKKAVPKYHKSLNKEGGEPYVK